MTLKLSGRTWKFRAVWHACSFLHMEIFHVESECMFTIRLYQNPVQLQRSFNIAIKPKTKHRQSNVKNYPRRSFLAQPHSISYHTVSGTTVFVTKLYASSPWKDFTAPRTRGSRSKYSVTSSAALRVLGCLHTLGLRFSRCGAVWFCCDLEACNLVMVIAVPLTHDFAWPPCLYYSLQGIIGVIQ
jgi:hypothetical protein